MYFERNSDKNYDFLNSGCIMCENGKPQSNDIDIIDTIRDVPKIDSDESISWQEIHMFKYKIIKMFQ